ncbi:MAG: succinate dehydrogenase, cytochrome b556 subunit [Mariprofundales bacterium]
MKQVQPQSPNLAIYRWHLTMIASILHRATGIVLLFLLPACLWLLYDLKLDINHFERDQIWLQSICGRSLVWILLVALAYHIINGLRFLLLDVGIGESSNAMRSNARFVLIALPIAAIMALFLVL